MFILLIDPNIQDNEMILILFHIIDWYKRLNYSFSDTIIYDPSNAKIKNLQNKLEENQEIQKQQIELKRENLNLKVLHITCDHCCFVIILKYNFYYSYCS